jgi:hypothetical protein
MLAIDVRNSDIILAMPHRQGGVARMPVALKDAGLGVSRIEPRGRRSAYRWRLRHGSPKALRRRD